MKRRKKLKDEEFIEYGYYEIALADFNKRIERILRHHSDPKVACPRPNSMLKWL